MNSKAIPGYKETEIGTIPDDWELKKINQVARINELNVDKSFKFKEIEYLDISSIKERRILEIRRILADTAPSRAKRIVRDNDILISTVRPNLKHYAFISNSTDRLIASTGFTVISPKMVNPHYLYYYLTSEYFTNYLTAIADTHTSTYPAFTPDVIEKSIMPFPSIMEQKRIGKVLSDLDAKIEHNNSMNNTLEQVGRTLFKQWFEDFEFPDNSGYPYRSHGGEFVYSEILGKDIPKSWRVSSIGDIARIQAGYAFYSNDFLKNGTIGIVKIKNIQGNIVDIKNTQYISEETASLIDKKYLIDPGSILIAMTGANVGKIGIIPKTRKELWLNQRVGMFKERVEKGLYFIYFLLSSEKYQGILRNRAVGTAQPNISTSDIESLELVVPPKEIIIQFGDLFESFFGRIIGNLYENEKISELRDLLIPKLIMGRLRLTQPSTLK